MRILVIGKNGQVGQSIQNLVNKTSNSNLSDYGFVFVGRDELDLSKASNIQAYFEKNKFDLVINCAAFTNVEKAEVDEKKFNFLYTDGDNCHFMDNETYEQVEIPKSIAGEQYKLLKENLEVTISFMEEKPISLELPNNIECTIENTDAAIKNQTASSSYKPALLDCGIKINVPPFIESGEKIVIDTRTLEYVKRVN